MKVVVETLGNEIVSDWSFKGYIGALNAGHEVEKLSLSAASMQQKRLKDERPMPIGSHGYMEWFFWLYGMQKPDPLNIPDFIDVDRKCWTVDKKKDLQYPVFVKPLLDAKRFTGFVANKESDFDLYPELEDWDGPYFCSEPFEGEVASEWRIFVTRNEIVNMSNYSGEPDTAPLYSFVRSLFDKVEKHRELLPKSYTIDIGLSYYPYNWHIIELNRAYSTAPYGINEDNYFKFLKVDWNEMVVKDHRPFKANRLKPEEIKEDSYDPMIVDSWKFGVTGSEKLE